MPASKPSWAGRRFFANHLPPARDSRGRFSKRKIAPQNQSTLFDADDLSTPPVMSEDPTSDAWDYYWPTKSINPPRPRTTQARYSSAQQRIEILWRNPMAPSYHYDNVPPSVWAHFKRVDSPGRFINSHLNNYPYGVGGWGTPDVD